MSDETKAIEESAKALQEVAKTGREAIDASRQVGGWLDRIFGRAIEDTVGRYWTDRMAASRVAAAIYDWERLAIMLHSVEQRLKSKGVYTTRTVPPKIALPLLEHATMEDEVELYDLWENLLVSGLDPSVEEIRRSYISVISELTAKDARAIRKMFAEWAFWDEHEVPDWRRDRSKRYASGVDAVSDESAVLFYRLGLVLPVHVEVELYRQQQGVTENTWSTKDPAFYVEGGDKVEVLSDLSVVGFTEFGEKFCRAVVGDVAGLYEPPDWATDLPKRKD